MRLNDNLSKTLVNDQIPDISISCICVLSSFYHANKLKKDGEHKHFSAYFAQGLCDVQIELSTVSTVYFEYQKGTNSCPLMF